MTRLALHHLTVSDVSHQELVAIAAETGCDSVCIFVNSNETPEAGKAPLFPLLAPAMKKEFARQLKDDGISVTNVDVFFLTADAMLENYRSKLELGADLGARAAVAMLAEPDAAKAVELVAQFSDMAAEFGLKVSLEFMGITPGCQTLAQAINLIEQAGRNNVGVAADTLHMHLTGTSLAELAALPPALLNSAQLCDIAAPFDPERISDFARYVPLALERLTPGEGIITLRDYIKTLPADTYYDLEVPALAMRSQHGISARQHAKKVVSAARSYLD
ncbi:MAG: hypothetical protein JWM78_3709 [Verrucomicrobiaceae bacterium]|nr:hypothetical protein [Verrucomicrobiaceae bacterium]